MFDLNKGCSIKIGHPLFFRKPTIKKLARIWFLAQKMLYCIDN